MTIDSFKYHISNFYELVISSLAYLCSLCSRKTQLWLISERGNEARDNGLVFFLYLKHNHPEINVKFIITKSSKDYYKLAQFNSDLIKYRSWKHHLVMWRATHLISTHIMGFTPAVDLYELLDHKFHVFKKKKVVFLQHGIITHNHRNLYGDSVRLDLFVAGAKPEFDYIRDNFNHPKGVVQYTGLCRYDRLYSTQCKKQILVMPTWRKYVDRSHFNLSTYFLSYKDFLLSDSLHSLLSKYGYSLVFYPHYEFQAFLHYFKELNLPSNIVIADFTFDVQSLLKDSSLLITDFSSVCFDFAYMLKPSILYQFDQTDYYNKHYPKGFFDSSSMFDIVTNKDKLLVCIEDFLSNDCKLKQQHLKNINDFFYLQDSNNSKRVYQCIMNL